MPSAPHPTQARTINSIYYAQNGLQGKSHDLGIAARVADTRAYGDDIERLLLVQGPLGLNWQRRKWGLLPRIENGELTGANPPTLERAQLWIELAPAVVGQPDWRFIKLHTHGGIPQNYETLLGDSMRGFLSSLAKLEGRGIRLHFVSARELINLVHAAEEGRSGDPHDWRDHRFERLSTPA